ncbi:helix-turn-helix transcriptional regulator [Carnobacterium maltaromaticum]|uniref:helix-turn-helix transcriptional regulator n=1 Tax=Carnobacterium maltaromaticum TaxID=2751 RepID=UPI001E5FFA35|nr:helix-turn-helix transcriptional regulator [Carnobacterium maltaromaticum]
MNQNNIGRSGLRAARKLKAVTQQRVADDIGVSEATIRNLESKRANPSFELVIKLSLYFETSFEKLWKEDIDSHS